MQCQQPNLRLIKIQVLRSEGKKERQEKRKEGKGRKRKIEKDRGRKDIEKDKKQWRSMEV